MIIGITGPICAGKDEVGKILAEFGFERLSLVEELRAEARKRGMELTRENLQDLGDELRESKGVDVLVRMVMKKIVPTGNYVVESIRNPGEVNALRELEDFILLCVDAPDDLRFERMRARARERDPKTFEDFIKLEARDRGIGQPEYAQQNEACWKMADFTIENNSSLDELKEKIKNLLSTKKFLPKKIIQVMTSLPSEESAREMAHFLLDRKVAACVQIIKSQSLFRWQGKLQDIPEWICIIKGSDFFVIESAIKEKHPYSVPEIIQLDTTRGNLEYSDWVRKEVF